MRLRKAVIGIVVFCASRILGGRKIRCPTAREIKVNLGCGLHCLAEWINVDGSLTALLGSRRLTWFNKILYMLAGSSAYYTFAEYNRVVRDVGLRFHNLRRGVSFKEGSVNVIYTSHFLEHLSKQDGKSFIEECYRVLKKGGLMRIVVPDLDVAFRWYQKGKVDQMLESFFFTSDAYDFAAHKYAYNFKTLSELLRKVGFVRVQRNEHRKGSCPDIRFLDVYPDHSLYIECRK